MNGNRMIRGRRCASLLAGMLGLGATLAAAEADAGYVQRNLVSDLPGVAQFMDPDLVNPWGMASSSMSPIWVSDNGTGLATLYNGAGVKQGLVVTILPAAGSPAGTVAAPTGQVFNPTSDFAAARFIFATEDGTISTFTGSTTTFRAVDNSFSGAIYKGLALAANASGNFLYAANFHSGNIDVFDKDFKPATLSGRFTDPSLPAGYAPFNIQEIGGKLYVTYAQQDAAKEDDEPGPGNGFLDVFDTNGVLERRLVSRGPLNSPWGLALAPANFGELSNDLLVGNFGDGRINAFDPTTGALLGPLDDPSGTPITIEGLWGLRFGNGGRGGAPNQLFFTAGIAGPAPGEIEDHGLFGDLTIAEPGSLAVLATGLVGLGWRTRRRRKGGFSTRA
jgi:uncharacterized protein (TIGR03118 family)